MNAIDVIITARKRMRAPCGQSIDALLHGVTEEMPADQRRERGDLFGRFLQQQKIGLAGMDQLGDIFRFGADTPQQIPACHTQAGYRIARNRTWFGPGHECRRLEESPVLFDDECEFFKANSAIGARTSL